MKKLKPDAIYSIKTQFGIMKAQYVGRQINFECCVCGKGSNAHTFNVWDSPTNYETLGFGEEHFPEILEELNEDDKINWGGNPLLLLKIINNFSSL